MNRILIFNFNPQSGVNNLHTGFMAAGCTVYNYGFKGDVSNREVAKIVYRTISLFKPDLIISYGWWKGRVNIDLFCELIRRSGIFHAFWAFDDPVCFHNISLPIGKKCQFVFTTVEECIDLYRSHGVQARLLLHGCDPLVHKRVAPVPQFKHHMVMLAHNYNVKWDPEYMAYRLNGINNVLIPLVNGGYDVMVWGYWWDSDDRIYNLPEKNYGKIIPFDREAEIYSSSKISLGLQTVGDSKTHLSVRTFEALACRSFHLCQYSPALEYFFKKGFHLEWSKSPDETLEIAGFYLKHEKLREKIAVQGQQEVYKNHTLQSRARHVLDVLKGLGLKGAKKYFPFRNMREKLRSAPPLSWPPPGPKSKAGEPAGPQGHRV